MQNINYKKKKQLTIYKLDLKLSTKYPFILG
jgi:hypothetical protein